MKEVALIHSEGILAGEMKHGPLALVDEHMPILVVATRDTMYSKMQSVIQQLLARNAQLIILCNEGDAAMQQYAAQGCRLIEVGGWVGPAGREVQHDMGCAKAATSTGHSVTCHGGAYARRWS
jgi:glucosamine 6-phosphate synthetase-like amidotransferase/phosphosugar isomerase protein